MLISDDDALETARAAFAERDWSTARAQFERVTDLPLADRADLATACFWLGAVDDSIRINQDVYERCAKLGAVAQAGLAALKAGYCESLRGNVELGAGWLARARRMFDEGPDAPERGFLLCVDAEFALRAGRTSEAEALADELLALGAQYDEPTFQANGLFTRGELAFGRGDIEAARQWFDEAMIPVHAGRVLAEFAGNLYCRLIQLCIEIADLARAQHWTTVTEQWCEGHAPASLFMGICRVHRVQLLQIHGDWERAVGEARRAAADLEHVDVTIAAEAYYELGELRRLLGDLDGAEAAYHQAHALGRDPLPGMALLHLGRGHVRVAASIIEAVLAVERAPLSRAPMLAAHIEVALTAGDLDGAVRSVKELSSIADDYESPGWRAMAQRWRGVVLHARERNAEAVAVLREARREWQRMDAPYLVARIRLDLADAADALGDHDSAERERDQAEAALERLGAQRDLVRLRSLRRAHARGAELSPRELEVVAVIASGASNREAAEQLHISETTVARHLANIYLKTDTPSRTAAIAWARERGLV